MGKSAAFGKCSGRFPGLLPAAHSSLITAIPSGDTASGWNSSLLLPHSVPRQGPEEGSDFQGREGDAQQDGAQAGETSSCVTGGCRRYLAAPELCGCFTVSLSPCRSCVGSCRLQPPWSEAAGRWDSKAL